MEVFTDTDSESKAIERVKDADIVLTDPFIAPLNKKVLESASQLKLLGISVISSVTVDLETANRLGIKVANIPGFATDALAELTFGLIISLYRKIPQGNKIMRDAPLEVDAGNPEHQTYKGIELKGKTLGVVGLGHIGKRVAELGNAFGMRVLAYDRNEKNLEDVQQVPLDQLLKESDVVSIHLMFSPELENLISEREFNLMKKDALLINSAPMRIINQDALVEALKSGKLLGAGFDVMAAWDKNNPLLAFENVIVTPHEGFFTDGTVKNIPDLVVTNVENFVKGTPSNLVN